MIEVTFPSIHFSDSLHDCAENICLCFHFLLTGPVKVPNIAPQLLARRNIKMVDLIRKLRNYSDHMSALEEPTTHLKRHNIFHENSRHLFRVCGEICMTKALSVSRICQNKYFFQMNSIVNIHALNVFKNHRRYPLFRAQQPECSDIIVMAACWKTSCSLIQRNILYYIYIT